MLFVLVGDAASSVARVGRLGRLTEPPLQRSRDIQNLNVDSA